MLYQSYEGEGKPLVVSRTARLYPSLSHSFDFLSAQWCLAPVLSPSQSYFKLQSSSVYEYAPGKAFSFTGDIKILRLTSLVGYVGPVEPYVLPRSDALGRSLAFESYHFEGKCTCHDGRSPSRTTSTGGSSF